MRKFLRFLFAGTLFFVLAGTLFAQTKLETGARQLTDEAAREQLAEFKKFRMPGDYCLRFQITHKPRNPDVEPTYFAGTLWGTWVDGVPRMRVSLRRLSQNPDEKNTRRLLIIGGNAPEIWELDEQGVPAKIADGSAAPFFAEMIVAPFDLQTPFVFWPDFKYLETKRLRGRVSHFYQFFPPQDFREKNPQVGSVRAAIDRTYNALVTVETLDGAGTPLKHFSLGSIKKVRDDYIFKTLDIRDERSRDKETLEVKEAALRLQLDAAYFEPASLTGTDLVLPLRAFERL